jgi:predicted nucleotidyltransferase
MNKSQLFQTIKDILIECEEIELAFLYGSYSINKETLESDIDIAVYQKTKKSSYDFRMTELKIENILNESLPGYKFDVRSLNDAPIIVIGKILNEGKSLFYKNEKFYYDYLVNSRLRYMDYSIIYNPLFNRRYENLVNDR